MSHVACSRASKSLEILMSAVVTMVVSKADKKRQSHSPAMMTCNRFELIFGTIGTLEVVLSPTIRLLLSSTMFLLRLGTAVRPPSDYKLPATVAAWLHVRRTEPLQQLHEYIRGSHRPESAVTGHICLQWEDCEMQRLIAADSKAIVSQRAMLQEACIVLKGRVLCL
jgi:hypothetical protein